MVKRIVWFFIISIACISCDSPQKMNYYLGVWNLGKIVNEKYASTLTLNGKHYKVSDGYIVITTGKKYMGAIYDISENLRITEISGKYPIFNLKVVLIDVEIENNNEVEKKYFGIIKVHFVNQNKIWFENALSKELDNLLKAQHFNIRFGPDKIYYRAEQISKTLSMDPNILQ